MKLTLLLRSTLVAMVVSTGGDAVGAAVPTPREHELAALQWQGAKDGRERLFSGIFRATGRDCRMDQPDSPKDEFPVKFFCAFDERKKLLRFDREAGGRFLAVDAQGRTTPEDGKGKYIRTPERSFCWSSDEYNVLIRGNVDAKPAMFATPFEVRFVGVAFNSTLDRYYNFRETYDLYAGFSAHKLLEVADEGGGICRVAAQNEKDPESFYTTWFNQNQGYSPIRIELRLGSLSAAPFQRGETTWQEIGGVWVPKTFMGEDFDFEGKVLKRKMELAFDWESVNQPVPERLFTVEGLDLVVGTEVISTELGKSIVVGFTGLQRNGPADVLENRPRSIAAVASTVLLVLVVAIFIVRQLRRRAAA